MKLGQHTVGEAAGGAPLGQVDERLREIAVMSVDPATACESCSADPARSPAEAAAD
jgi:hypothetical protein